MTLEGISDKTSCTECLKLRKTLTIRISTKGTFSIEMTKKGNTQGRLIHFRKHKTSKKKRENTRIMAKSK